MAQDLTTTSELTIDVTCTPRNRANLRRLKTNSVQSFQRWEKENELLYAMIEDESAWLSTLFPDAFITPELFFYALEDGTILCLLANFIQEMAESYGARTGKSVPGKKFAFHKSKKGARESKLFYSRENVGKFLTWCRWHGIPEAILFESNDAVLVDECRTGGREIVICLMEIARRSSQYEIEEVPQLIKLEREIEEEELSDVQGCAEEQQGLPLDTSTVNTGNREDRSPIDSDSGVESVFEEGDPASPRLSEFGTDDTIPESTKVVPKDKSMNKSEGDKKQQRVVQKDETNSLLDSSQPKTELDKKVCKIAQEYNIKIVHRLKEGKYIILGKTMFVRMLNDHLLVRIGGGWDTLDHYVMTHASKSTVSEGITTTTPSSSERKSSGVWSKLVDKVKRRESQPNLTDSPVVISKRERPDSSPSVYRLRDRVRKKLSVTEKDEKDISDAIRKVESSLSSKSTDSSSFTSKTFFQLKSRFASDKGRKLSRDNSFDKKENKKMADQNGEAITREQQEKKSETLETTHGDTEEFATSTTTVTEFSSSEFHFDSGKGDLPADITSTQTQPEENVPSGDNFLLFDQQTQQSTMQSEVQSFPSTNTDDLFSSDNPPWFLSEALQPEQARDENQVEAHKDDEESGPEMQSAANQEALKTDTDFLVEVTPEIESKPGVIPFEAGETEPASASVTQENEPTPNNEEQLEQTPQEPAVGEQDDSFPEVAGEIESEPIKISSESQETESAPLVLPPEDNERPEVDQGEQQQLDDAAAAAEMPMEHIGPISNEAEQGDNDEIPTQGISDDAITLETEQTETVSRGEEQLEDIELPPQVIQEDLQSSETAVKDMEYVASQDRDNAGEVLVPEAAVQDVDIMHKGEDYQDEGLPAQVEPGADLLISSEEDKEVISNEQEEPDERDLQAQKIDESSQDAKETLTGISSVVEYERTMEETSANIIDVEETQKVETGQEPEKTPSSFPQKTEEPKSEQNETEQKEIKNIPLDKPALPVNHKKPSKKAPGTTKKEHDRAANTSASKSLNGSKKEDQKGERLKGSATKPAPTRTTKSPATTAPKAKTGAAVPGARSTSATKRPVSAQTHKSGGATSKQDAQKLPANVTSKTTAKTTTPKTTTPKTTTRPTESRKPAGAANARPTNIKDKKPPTPSSGTQKPESLKSRPRSAVSGKPTDKTDGKVGSHSRPLSAKTRPFSGTTRTTTKTTTTITKTASGPASKSEVSKTTITASKGGTISSTTTVKKTTEPGGKTKVSKETTAHQKPPSRNKTSEVKSGTALGKPGSAASKPKPASAATKGKPGSTMTKGKPTSERPKSPTKGTAKKTAAVKDESTVSKVPVEEKTTSEPPATSPLPEASDLITPDITADSSQDSVTKVIQHSEVIEDDGETKIVHTKEVTATVLENGEQQTVTTETVVEESG